MNDNNLTLLIEQLRTSPIPSAPENLEATVLRSIRSSRPSESSIVLFPGLLRFTFAVAVTAILIGWAVGSATIRYDSQTNKLLARNALSLEAFDSGSIRFSPTPLQ